jgi:hypothetical protein
MVFIKGEIFIKAKPLLPIPVAVQTKAWVCGRSLTGIVDSNPA